MAKHSITVSHNNSGPIESSPGYSQPFPIAYKWADSSGCGADIVLQIHNAADEFGDVPHVENNKHKLQRVLNR